MKHNKMEEEKLISMNFRRHKLELSIEQRLELEKISILRTFVLSIRELIDKKCKYITYVHNRGNHHLKLTMVCIECQS